MSSSILLLAASGIIAALSVPLILDWVPPNHLYGFRTPSTFASEALWYRVNHFAGWALLIAAIVGGFFIVAGANGALPQPDPEPIALVVPLLLAIVASFVYLWIATRRE